MTTFNFSSIRDAVGYYLDCGLEPIPLKPLSKKPVFSNWHREKINQQWDALTGQANIGLRCGGSSLFAVIDCDNKNTPDTFKNVIAYFKKINLSFFNYPIVSTSSGIGRHIYFMLTEPLEGNSLRINPCIGSGEFRFGSGACVVAPPSFCEKRYELISGDFRKIPSAHPEDFRDLVNGQIISERNNFELPRNALRLLNSNGLQFYESQSEKDQAIITSILNKANNESFYLSEEEILQVFLDYKSGKAYRIFQDNPKAARNYIHICHKNANEFTLEDSPLRKKILNTIYWAKSKPWKGRTGSTDKAVYLSHAQIAYNKGSMPYHASCRDLAMLANVSSPNTISKANKRLIERGLISLEQESVARLANTYILLKIDTLPQYQPVRECPFMVSNDSFCWGALNRSGYEIYSSLIDTALTAIEIAEKTGRGMATVKRKLERMSSIKDIQSGEVIAMVKEVEGRWIANKVDLDKVAEILGSSGNYQIKATKFNEDRKRHSRDLLLGHLND
jgi:predicted transcriptional regulator